MNTMTKNITCLDLIELDGEPCVVCVKDGEDLCYPITNAKEIVVCNDFLRSLDTGCDIKFEGYKEYAELIDVMRMFFVFEDIYFNDKPVDLPADTW